MKTNLTLPAMLLLGLFLPGARRDAQDGLLG